MESFDFIPVADIAIWPTVRNLQITDRDIVLKTGKRWYEGYAIDNTISYEEPGRDSEHGQLFDKELKGILPHDAVEMASSFYRNKYTPMILRYTDRGGVSRVIGTPAEPVRVHFGYENAAAQGGTKGWSFAFRGTHTHPSYYMLVSDAAYFFIDENGYLIYEGGLSESFALTDGDLVVTGPDENDYTLSGVDLKK